MKNQTRILAFLLFTLIAVAAYWQVAFLYNALKWDMIDCYIPWRGFVEDCISDRQFPYWCPYQYFGYPIHANMLSVVSPEYWISGFLQGSFSANNLHIFFILFVIIAGYGMYKLTTHLGSNKSASFCAGVVYMLSGYIVSQGQEMSSLAGMAWLPFTILYYLKMSKSFTYADTLKTSVFMFLMISGAFPAITIILNYLFLSFFLVYFIKAFIKRNYIEIRKLIYYNFILYLLVLLMSTFFIVSLKQSVPYVERFSGLSVDKVLLIPFTPQSLISLIFPLASVKAPDFFKANLTMNNIYIGLFFLIFSIVSVFRKKSLIENILVVFGLISLLAAFGSYTPVRSLLYHLPLMSMFKESSFFRPFIILPMIVVGAKSLSDFLENQRKHRNSVFLVSWILLGAVAAATTLSFFRLGPNSIPFFHDLELSDVYGHIFFQGLIQLAFLIAFNLLIRYYKHFNYSNVLLVILIVADMIVSVQLNMYYTIVNPYDAKDMNQYVKSQPHGFPIPDQRPVKDNTDASVSYFPLWQNTNTISRRISFEGFNSFKIKYRTWLFDNYRELHDKVIMNPPLYLSNEIYLFDSVKIKKSDYSDKALFFYQDEFSPLKNIKQVEDSTAVITPIDYSPTHIIARVNCSDSTIVTFLQTLYTGWNYYVDGKEKHIYRSNLNFMSGVVPAGGHVIEFRYSNIPVLAGFIVTYSVFILVLMLILFITLSRYFKRPVSVGISAFVLMLFAFLLFSFYNNDDTISDVARSEYGQIKTNLNELVKNGSNTVIILNCDRPDLEDTIKSTFAGTEVNYFRIEDYRGLSSLSKLIDTLKQQKLIYFQNKIASFPGIEDIITEKFPSIIYERNFSSGKLCLYSKGKPDSTYQLKIVQDFRISIPHWNVPEYTKYDSIEGKKLMVLDSTSLYSSAFASNTSELGLKKRIKKIVFKTNFIASDKENELFLVVKYKKPMCKKRDWYFPLKMFVEKENQLSHAVLTLKTDIAVSKKNRLEVFLWNAGRKKVMLEKIEIFFY